MELQLGLALPTNNPIEGFDLNRFGYESKDHKGLLLLGSDPFKYQNGSSFVSSYNNKKRRFDQAFLESIDDHDQAIITPPVPKTLPLFLWNNHPNGDEDDDPNKEINKNQTFSFIKRDGVVGWPPIKAWRKKLCCHGGNRTVENGCSCGGRISKFMYVKVKMEGMAIARKVDLNLHSCFETLKHTLMDMFGKYQEDSDNYKLTYQDREGDWLLAQDVPWRTFIRSVQRLKLLRRTH